MQMTYFCQLWTNASSTCIFHILKMIPNKQLYLVFLFGALEDACSPMIASCFFFLLHLKMLAARWLHLAFLSIALEDACSLVIASCFSFYGTWRCLPPGNCILLFFLWYLRMLAARWLYLVFLSMALEDACSLVIASCFSFHGTWRCLLPGDCILLFFLWHLKILAARWLHLAFLSMVLEDACSLVIASYFSFYGTWRCLLPGDCILLFFLWHLRMLAAWLVYLYLAFFAN